MQRKILFEVENNTEYTQSVLLKNVQNKSGQILGYATSKLAKVLKKLFNFLFAFMGNVQYKSHKMCIFTKDFKNVQKL